MKTVWVLGAGASKSHSKGKFPLINDFFVYGKENGVTAKSSKTLKDEFKQIGNYIKENFGKNILNKSEKIDIEQILTNLDIDSHKQPYKNLQPIRSQIINLIRKILLKESSNLNNVNGEYAYLRKCPNDTIVTFNWDLLLDNILDRKRILMHEVEIKDNEIGNQYYNMVHNISAIGEFTFEGLEIKQPYASYNAEKGYYLKMHGSIDWVYCKNDSCRACNKVFPIYDIANDLYCSECNEFTEYLIIPPVLNKQYDIYPIIKRIWNKAEKELNIAAQIIIWGYSLPPTDFYSNWLLRQSNNNLQKLIIINPAIIKQTGGDIKKTRLNKGFTKPFTDIFKNKISKDEILYFEDFNDYQKSKTIFKKYPELNK